MGIQYIHDENGEKTAVIISIQDWKKIQAQLVGKEVLENQEEVGPASYYGAIKLEGVDIDTELKRLRNEWDRM